MQALRTVLIGVGSIAFAQAIAVAARDQQPPSLPDTTFAPAPGSARLLSAGYNELAADLLMFRLVGYFGGGDYTPEGVASLVEAIIALDPHFHKIYEWGALATMMGARRQPDPTPIILRAIRVLEQGAEIYHDDYRLPLLAGQAYVVDLRTTDPAQRRAWDLRGAELLEAAVRKPKAPAETALLASTLRTKLGQHQRAQDNLRELFLITDDLKARKEILDKLAQLEGSDSMELASELLEQRRLFETRLRHDRPYMPASLYVLIGETPKPGFDPVDLATGGRDLITTQLLEPAP